MTLLEVIVAVVIMAMVAATLYPTIGAQLRSARASALARQFESLREAIDAYNENVGQYPRHLAQLVASPTTGALDLCGTPLTASERSRWRGPYLTHAIQGDFPVGEFTIKDTIIRVPANTSGGQVGTMQIRAQSVDSAVAFELESQFDGGLDYATGTILWVPTASPVGNLTFQVPIRGC